MDGFSCKHGSGAGIVLLGPDNFKCEYALRFNFKATNNMAEYEALILGLTIVKELKIKNLLVKNDSQLVVSQIDGTYTVKDEIMSKYLALVNNLVIPFNNCAVQKIDRADHELADVLSKQASSYRSIFTEVLDEPSIMPPQMMTITTSNNQPCWMNEIIAYLTEQYKSVDGKDVVRIARKSARFLYENGELRKRSNTLPYAKCLNPIQADQIQRILHEGIGGGHYGGRALSRALVRAGYFWPGMHKDAISFAKNCDQCQRHGNFSKQPPEELKSMVFSWAFDQWGLDIVGPLPIASGQSQPWEIGC